MGILTRFHLWLCIAVTLSGCATPLPFPFHLRSGGVFLPSSTSLAGGKSGGSTDGVYFAFQQPTSLSVRDGYLYIVDGGVRRLLQYDNSTKTIIPFDIGSAIEPGMNLFIAADKSVYIANPEHSEVLHFSSDGLQLPPIVSLGNLPKPVSVIVDKTEQLMVADGLLNQVVVFDSWGSVVSIIKLPHMQSIVAMADGPDGIYILDGGARQIFVLRPDGFLIYSVSVELVGKPNSLAVSKDNLIFVGDSANRSITIYQDARLYARFLGDEGGGGGFANIDGLAVDGNRLYISDSVNSRIHVLQINPYAVNRDDKDDSGSMLTITQGGALVPISSGEVNNRANY